MDNFSSASSHNNSVINATDTEKWNDNGYKVALIYDEEEEISWRSYEEGLDDSNDSESSDGNMWVRDSRDVSYMWIASPASSEDQLTAIQGEYIASCDLSSNGSAGFRPLVVIPKP